jgi:hypothetical protein
MVHLLLRLYHPHCGGNVKQFTLRAAFSSAPWSILALPTSVLAHRDLASRIHFRNAAKADKLEPTRMTHSGVRQEAGKE